MSAAASAPCDKCKGHRWMFYAMRQGREGMEGQWRPFGRDAWSETGSLAKAAALASKVLAPCDCNPKGFMPWAAELNGNGTKGPATADGAARPY